MTRSTWIGWCVGMALAAVVVTATMAWSAGQVSGKYVGNGQEAKLTHAVVVPHEPWEGEQAYTVILSEKDPAGVKKPDFDAMFGKLGHALIVSLTRKGDIFSTQVCHQGLQKSGFSTVGSLFVDKLKIEGGQISGHFFTKQPETFFEDTWEADLTFQAKLP